MDLRSRLQKIRRSSIPIGFLLLLAALLANAFLTRRQLGVQVDNQSRLSHSREVLLQLEDTDELLHDAETSQSGYLYTHDPRYLVPYSQAMSQVDSQMSMLDSLVADDPKAQAKMSVLYGIERKKIAALEVAMELDRQGWVSEAKRVSESDPGLFMMSDLRTEINSLRIYERSLEAAWSIKSAYSIRVTIAYIYLTNFIAACGAGLLGLHLRGEMVAREQSTMKLADSEQQMRALASRLQVVAETERLRISRELHDQLGQALTGIKMDLNWIVHKHSTPKAPWVPMVLESMHTIEAAVVNVRNLSAELRPQLLDTLGLRAAIEWDCEQFERRTGIACAINSIEESLPISDDEGIAIFRIFQEALTNVSRHAQANFVTVTIAANAERVIFTIEDNGIGFPVEVLARPYSLGLVGMRERASLINAMFHIESSPGNGTTVTVSVPVQNSVAKMANA